MAPSMFPPPMQDTACSGPFPPNTTATLIFRCTLTLPPVVPPSGGGLRAAASGAVGSGAVGSGAVGSGAVGSGAVGSGAVGLDAAGSAAVASDAIAFRLRGAAGEQDCRLADLEPVPDDRHHDLRDRHLHAMPVR